ncbi:MAG TPA: transposase, partial [Acidimicrobiales bacterium]|nr:transposase [Acidimicrobiales bacterium]
MNLSTLAKHFSDEAAAWELVERMRWPDGPVCPHCGDRNWAYFLKPRSGSRKTS